MIKNDDTTSFTLVFSKGLADRNRLPIEQVISTLREFQEMVREVGKHVQRRNGVENPDGDFGIELVATAAGLVFQKGSLKANAAPTRDIRNAQETLRLVVDNVRSYAKPQNRAMDSEDASIARRMAKIGELQREAKTELAVQVKEPSKRLRTATLNEKAIFHLETLNAPRLNASGLSLFGRLRQLNDKSAKEDGGKYFWGELLTDASETWRLKFRAGYAQTVIPLFRKQVLVQGDATYFGAKSPRLEVTNISEDFDRDYLAAFDGLRTAGEVLFGDENPESLLEELHG